MVCLHVPEPPPETSTWVLLIFASSETSICLAHNMCYQYRQIDPLKRLLHYFIDFHLWVVFHCLSLAAYVVSHCPDIRKCVSFVCLSNLSAQSGVDIWWVLINIFKMSKWKTMQKWVNEKVNIWMNKWLSKKSSKIDDLATFAYKNPGIN